MRNIVFISYQEPNADNNWLRLQSRFPDAQRIHGINGIHNAHKQAANIFYTPFLKTMIAIAGKLQDCNGRNHFWVIDGDSTVADDFDFKLPKQLIRDGVYVYKARNPINGLSYGYGGIKLLPIDQTINMNTNTVDMTTAISKHFFPVDQIASTTNFNTDPFNTWKSAFRECVKLSSKIINGQVDAETEYRLDTWCNNWIDDSVPNVVWAIKGARDGQCYGKANAGNLEALKQINDFDRLASLFQEYDSQQCKQ